MKNKKIILFLVPVIVFFIVGSFFLLQMKKESFSWERVPMATNIYKKNIEISLGEKLPTSKDYGTQFTNPILWLDKDIEEKIMKAGKYQGIISFGHTPIFITLSVIDTQPPVIQNVENITTFIGEEVDLKSKVTVADNSKEDIELIVKGDYSFHKEGIYPLIYEARDFSGNISTANFQLIVKKKVEKPLPSNSSTTIMKTTKGYDITKKNGVYYIKGFIIANKSYALPNTYTPGGLTKETTAAFDKMKAAAKKEGINLNIISGYRSYTKQQSTYNRYVNRDGKKEADRYSARPGHSEHQTGLAFDVNSLEQSFGNTKTGKWLSENCYKYGFILRYPKGKENITGYMYEPWHFRYIGNEAKELYNNGNWITLEEYLGIDSKYD